MHTFRYDTKTATWRMYNINRQSNTKKTKKKFFWFIKLPSTMSTWPPWYPVVVSFWSNGCDSGSAMVYRLLPYSSNEFSIAMFKFLLNCFTQYETNTHTPHQKNLTSFYCKQFCNRWPNFHIEFSTDTKSKHRPEFLAF